MNAILGIDAAWTEAEPSGVALVIKYETNWQLCALAPSYEHFYALADGEGNHSSPQRPSGSLPDAAALIASATKICGRKPDLAAIDMPLALHPITKRRPCDNAVSSAYGKYKCGTHTPNQIRPGAISDNLRESFCEAGFSLLTNKILLPGLIEAYPHPALVELSGASERLRYKLSRLAQYWPGKTVDERKVLLFEVWAHIAGLLDSQITGVEKALPMPSLKSSRREMKAYEDRLDAVVCAFIGICALEGRAQSYNGGDLNSAIWVPKRLSL